MARLLLAHFPRLEAPVRRCLEAYANADLARARWKLVTCLLSAALENAGIFAQAVAHDPPAALRILDQLGLAQPFRDLL